MISLPIGLRGGLPNGSPTGLPVGARIVRGRCVVPGHASGFALVTRQRLAGSNAIDVQRGHVAQRGHELEGAFLKGRVLVFKGAAGSSGWSAVLHQLRLNGHAPAAMLFTALSAKAALGAVVAHAPSMTAFECDDLMSLVETGDWVDVDATEGLVRITKALALSHANGNGAFSHENEQGPGLRRPDHFK